MGDPDRAQDRAPLPERPYLGHECPGELVEGALRAVLLLAVLYMGKPARAGHGRQMNGGHLRREHGFHFVLRGNALYHRNHEIEAAFVRFTTIASYIDELPENPVQKRRCLWSLVLA